MNNLQFDDKVRHITNNNFNATLITVIDIKAEIVECEYFNFQKKVFEKVEFHYSELELVQRNEGGFI
jgi:hypothetical protein